MFLHYEFHVVCGPELKISKNQNALQGKNNTNLKHEKYNPTTKKSKCLMRKE